MGLGDGVVGGAEVVSAPEETGSGGLGPAGGVGGIEEGGALGGFVDYGGDAGGFCAGEVGGRVEVREVDDGSSSAR